MSRFLVKNVWRETEGSFLKQALTTSWTDGDPLSIEDITDAEESGGKMVFKSGEVAYYTGVNPLTEQLTGVTRPGPRAAQAIGSFVQFGSEPVVTTYASGYYEDEDVLITGVTIPEHLSPYFMEGARDDDGLQAVTVGLAENRDDLFVTAAPSTDKIFDPNLEIVPPSLWQQRRPSRYYGSPIATNNSYAVSRSPGHLSCAPFLVSSRTRFDRIAIHVNTGAAGATIALGIYGDVDGFPGPLLLNAGTVNAATSGAKSITIDHTLERGNYYLAALPLVAATVFNVIYELASTNWWIGTDDIATGDNPTGYSKTGQASLPADFPTSATRDTTVARVLLRRKP